MSQEGAEASLTLPDRNPPDTLALSKTYATLHRVSTATPRQFIETLYKDTIAALHPGAAVHAALDQLAAANPREGPVHLIGLGKAAPAMCAAALDWHAARRMTVADGICISHDPGGVPVSPLPLLIGDHPVPGARSHRSAAALGAYIEARIGAGDNVIVLLSGGTSALIGAPRPGMTEAAYDATSAALTASGFGITAINRERSRLSRWGGGALGQALTSRGARVDVLVISDVIGDDLAAIGSGPCVAPPDVAELHIAHHIISNNASARATVVSLAAMRDTTATEITEPLNEGVGLCADRIGLALRTFASAARTGQSAPRARVLCWGGEPTVSLPSPEAPPGGRMQALALLLAKQLHDAGDDARGITVLCAGTDGRDGATSAAGAVVDAQTWSTILATGRSPAKDLETFHSHQALAVMHATIPAFASGTNVNDLVIAMIEGGAD